MAASGIDPKIDYVFKRLFGDECRPRLLIDLLNATLDLPPGRPVRQIEIRSPFSLKGHTQEKVSDYDVKAQDELGRQSHLEIQMVVPFSFGQRALY